MIDTRIILTDIESNSIPKYKRIVNAFKESIEINAHKSGDSIPSINEFSKDYKISRDTVYKAYSLLKKEGLIKSTPNKGYYISESNKRILLLISTFKAYKEVFYHSFVNSLPDNITVDLQFHHHNVKNFKSMLDVDNGKYFKYVVMGFDHPEVVEALSQIDKSRLLLIDWKANLNKLENFVFQDFGKSFSNCLEEGLYYFKKYKNLVFVYPSYTHHPYESVEYFVKFCKTHDLNYEICETSESFHVNKHNAYITVNDRMLYKLLRACRTYNYELGKDVGVLSYNDTPLKEFTHKGISVISVDFTEFGKRAADFITSTEPVRKYLTTKLILRDSL